MMKKNIFYASLLSKVEVYYVDWFKYVESKSFCLISDPKAVVPVAFFSPVNEYLL
jgi:hypothetical protein